VDSTAVETYVTLQTTLLLSRGAALYKLCDWKIKRRKHDLPSFILPTILKFSVNADSQFHACVPETRVRCPDILLETSSTRESRTIASCSKDRTFCI